MDEKNQDAPRPATARLPQPAHERHRLGAADQMFMHHAFRSLNEDDIRAYCRKSKSPVLVEMANVANPLLFWQCVHTTRLALPNITLQDKRASEDWLRSRGLNVPRY